MSDSLDEPQNDNPWHLKNRPYWKVDPLYKSFSKRLYNELWTYEQTCDECKIDETYGFPLLIKTNDSVKQSWLRYVKQWNKDDKLDGDTGKTKGFAAIVFLMISLPYTSLPRDEFAKNFTVFEANKINMCYYYNSDGHNLPFKNMRDIFNEGPLFPPAYMEWLDNQYNRASWWLSYHIFERNNNLKPIIDSPPASLI